MVALSDGRLSGIHTSYRNMTVLSWVLFLSEKFHFLLSIGLESYLGLGVLAWMSRSDTSLLKLKMMFLIGLLYL